MNRGQHPVCKYKVLNRKSLPKARARPVQPPQVEHLVHLERHDQQPNRSSDNFLNVDLLIAFLVAHVKRHWQAEVHEHADGRENGGRPHSKRHVVVEGDDELGLADRHMCLVLLI